MVARNPGGYAAAAYQPCADDRRRSADETDETD
jgi:hypothetical protein